MLHVACEQRRMCLTQFSAPLDKLRMASLAFECEQTEHDTGTAFRLVNGRLRKECSNARWFLSLNDAKRKIDQRRIGYNETRPHSAL